VVLIEWNDDVDEAVVIAFTEGLRTLRSQIPTIRAYAYGPNLGMPGSTADFVICADFDDLDGFVAYRDHPAHDAFRAEHLAPNARSRTAAQYELP
jgi:hypothetical protein